LPASYLLQRKQHRQQQFRLLTCVAVIALCLLGTYGQQIRLAGLKSQKRLLEEHYAQLESQLADDHLLENQMKKLEAKANLLATLRLRPSVSRLLAEFTANRPQHVSLQSFNLEIVTRAQTKVANPKSNQKEKQSQTVPLPAVQDLQQLHKQANQHDLQIQLTGIAPDDVAISNYLVALERSGFTQNVQLIYTDHYLFNNEQLRKFVIQLLVRKPNGFTPTDSLMTDRSTD